MKIKAGTVPIAINVNLAFLLDLSLLFTIVSCVKLRSLLQLVTGLSHYSFKQIYDEALQTITASEATWAQFLEENRASSFPSFLFFNNFKPASGLDAPTPILSANTLKLIIYTYWP